MTAPQRKKIVYKSWEKTKFIYTTYFVFEEKKTRSRVNESCGQRKREKKTKHLKIERNIKGERNY